MAPTELRANDTESVEVEPQRGSLDPDTALAAAPHLAEGALAPPPAPNAISQAQLADLANAADGRPDPNPDKPGKLWKPRRVLITPDALRWPHGRAIAERAAALGAEITELRSNRLTSLSVADATGVRDKRKSYALAKTTLAVVVAPPGQRKLQPIPPSADWQFHLAQGCPAHCQYCYLAGSLSGPPITRAYANLPEILGSLHPYLGQGKITSRSRTRADEGTTFEASCYTDPLGIEHLTGSLAATIAHFGQWQLAGEPAPVQLRFTTKFADVTPLLALAHNGRTRARFSVNAATVARDFEGGTSPMPQRLRALGRMARAGYPVGLTIAPIMPVPDWQQGYRDLLTNVAQELSGIPNLDLTTELITHRFTETSRDVLLSWYPTTPLDLDKANRTEKRTKFGGFKYVYPKDSMTEMRTFFETAIPDLLPSARILYWT